MMCETVESDSEYGRRKIRKKNDELAATLASFEVKGAATEASPSLI
jgi:hypothetical protein